jgi:hypothetical protein
MERFPTQTQQPDPVTEALKEFPMTPEEAQEPTMVTNHMQLMLAQLSGEDIGDFIEHHAQTFRALVEEHPEYVSAYRENPARLLRELAPLFRGDTMLH